MKRFLCLLLTVLMTVTIALPASAMITESYVQLVHIKIGTSFNTQKTVFYDSLEQAVQDAASGDVIEVFDNVTVASPIAIPAEMELTIVSGTKREHTTIYGDSAFEKTDKNATTRTVKKNFDGSLFTLGENSKVTFENVILDGSGKGGTKGGLIYAENGATLTLTKGEYKSGVTLKNAKLTDNTFGGAVYAEKNATVSVENAVFSGNDASCGKDIFLKCKTSLTLAENVMANTSISGDVNGDFKVDIKDLVRLKKIFAGIPNMKVENFSPDISCDGVTDIGDLAELKIILLTYY